jgi:hypothetical protein
MSSFVARTIACPCGERYVANVANGLHVSNRPDVRAQILDGTFHRFDCPRCGQTAQVDVLLAYTDFPKRQWFTVAPSGCLPWRRGWIEFATSTFESSMVVNAPELVRGWGREMTRRLVFGLASLREKIVAFDAGLDDRVVELVKIQLLRALGGPVTPQHYFYLVEVRGDELVYERTADDGLIRKLPVPRQMYEDVAGLVDLEDHARRAFPDGILIDYRAIFAPHAHPAEPSPVAPAT